MNHIKYILKKMGAGLKSEFRLERYRKDAAIRKNNCYLFWIILKFFLLEIYYGA